MRRRTTATSSPIGSCVGNSCLRNHCHTNSSHCQESQPRPPWERRSRVRVRLHPAAAAEQVEVEPGRIAESVTQAQTRDGGGARRHLARRCVPPASAAHARRSAPSALHQVQHLADVPVAAHHELELVLGVAREQLDAAGARSARSARCRPRNRPSGSELEVFGETESRSHANSGASVPAVSTVVWCPAEARAAARSGSSRCSSGSPPVITTCAHPDAAASATSSPTLRRDPSGPPRRVRRVAPGAAEVAPRGADEERGDAGEHPLPLDRRERLRDDHA